MTLEEAAAEAGYKGSEAERRKLQVTHSSAGGQDPSKHSSAVGTGSHLLGWGGGPGGVWGRMSAARRALKLMDSACEQFHALTCSLGQV